MHERHLPATMSSERYESGRYLSANPSWHEEDSEWKASRILRLLRRSGHPAPASIAEVGCGTGGILRALHGGLPPSTTLAGYDIAPAAIARASRLADERLSFHCEDITQAGKVFDLLLCIDVIEHIEDPFAFLRAMSAIAPRVVFNIPLEMHVAGVLIDHQLWTRRQFGHLHFYTAALAFETLRECGYRVSAHDYPSRLMDQPRSASEWLFWLPRKLTALASPELSARLFGGTSLLALAASPSA
jgi:SAM-dependent methyltransferase